MCCRSEDEEKIVRDYVNSHQEEMLKNLGDIGVTNVVVKQSRTREGSLGRFIISFQNAKHQEICHMTLICEGTHWDENKGIREPHFTINEQHYFYIFDERTNTLRFRDPRRKLNLVPLAIVNVMEKMLREISPKACPKKLNSQN